MNPLELKTYPDPCLRIKTRPVEKFDAEVNSVIQQMTEIMYLNQGIGLAAPQVGLGLSLIVIDIGDGLKVFANPEKIESSKDTDTMEEGCLSLPCVTAKVPRPKVVRIKAIGQKGDAFLHKYNGLLAKVIQHEMDHLKGKLLIDYLNPVSRFFAEKKLHKQKTVCRNPDVRL